MMTVKMDWKGKMKFEGTGVFGHKIITDGPKGFGGEESGYKPTELLLYGIAGCTGIDVVKIMERMKQKLTDLSIEVIAHQKDEYPKFFYSFEIKYYAKGENLDASKLAEAIELSHTKFCSVSQTVENGAKVSTSYEIL